MKKIVFPMAALAILFATSCQKDKNTIPAETATTKATTMNAQVGGGFKSVVMSGKSRKVNSKFDCYGTHGPCAPKDIIIIAPHQNELDQAMKSGASAVKTLFSNEATALVYFPDWNEPYFVDVKAAILSGQYTFIKAPGSNTYLLGKEGVVSIENYDYAIPYKL